MDPPSVSTSTSPQGSPSPLTDLRLSRPLIRSDERKYLEQKHLLLYLKQQLNCTYLQTTNTSDQSKPYWAHGFDLPLPSHLIPFFLAICNDQSPRHSQLTFKSKQSDTLNSRFQNPRLFGHMSVNLGGRSPSYPDGVRKFSDNTPSYSENSTNKATSPMTRVQQDRQLSHSQGSLAISPSRTIKDAFSAIPSSSLLNDFSTDPDDCINETETSQFATPKSISIKDSISMAISQTLETSPVPTQPQVTIVDISAAKNGSIEIHKFLKSETEAAFPMILCPQSILILKQ
ncbi:hypothetical protein BLNAU_19176 [Blattamonas nauphoetae]|uniref:Uncharacterized protein n=1 Tax=Blattamonas nauphoetae TaxID=2049346 RepID=A0ABQ9X6C6_9EUKA|nr:hypothetical protein BLNAU_19176 [Blattamonas nauphoetae]